MMNEKVSTQEKADQEILLPDYVHAYVLRNAAERESAGISDQNKSDWQSVARVMDRLFLVIFLVVVIIVTAFNYSDYENK